MVSMYTEKETCDILQVSRSTLNALRKRGLPHYKIGRTLRYEEKDLLQWLSEQRKITTEKESQNGK